VKGSGLPQAGRNPPAKDNRPSLPCFLFDMFLVDITHVYATLPASPEARHFSGLAASVLIKAFASYAFRRNAVSIYILLMSRE